MTSIGATAIMTKVGGLGRIYNPTAFLLQVPLVDPTKFVAPQWGRAVSTGGLGAYHATSQHICLVRYTSRRTARRDPDTANRHRRTKDREPSERRRRPIPGVKPGASTGRASPVPGQEAIEKLRRPIRRQVAGRLIQPLGHHDR
jgi:hypothetical protein